MLGFTHFLQLFYAGRMHYDFAGCTLASGQRFLLKKGKAPMLTSVFIYTQEALERHSLLLHSQQGTPESEQLSTLQDGKP